MTPPKKRPKVRYVARGLSLNKCGDYNYGIYPNRPTAAAIAMYSTPSAARRIASALNFHEAHKRGEL